MDTFTAIKSRRSIKSFDVNHKMSSDEISKILESALLSPTSYNIQNWRFVTVTDQKLKDKLSELSHGQRHVSEASLAIVLCADLNSWDKKPQKILEKYPRRTTYGSCRISEKFVS